MADKTGIICSLNFLSGATSPSFNEYLDYEGTIFSSLGDIKGTPSPCLNAYVDRDGKIAEIRPLFRSSYVEISGSCSGAVELSGVLDFITSVDIEGSCSATVGLSGVLDIVTVVQILGDISGTVGLSGVLSISSVIQIAGGVSGTAELGGLLYVVTAVPFAGNISSRVTLSSILIVRTYSGVWPHERWTDYNPDLTWDEETEIWVTDVAGSGRYKQQLVTVGYDDDGNGVVYYG